VPVDQAKIQRIFLEAEVLRALNRSAGWLTTDQVARACNQPDGLVRTALARLAALQEVESATRVKRGPLYWRLAP
jgi:predicted transcriptional regulator